MGIVFLYGMEKTNITFLNKIENILIRVVVAHSDFNHKPEVRNCQFLNRSGVMVLVNKLCNLTFFFQGKHRIF